MKNSVYPNQGQPVQDIYTTGISRVFIDGGNAICVLESRCGIEDHSNTYINETARLIIPLQDLEHIKASVENAIIYANDTIQNNNIEFIKPPAKESTEQNKEKEGNPIAFFE